VQQIAVGRTDASSHTDRVRRQESTFGQNVWTLFVQLGAMLNVFGGLRVFFLGIFSLFSTVVGAFGTQV
jgi:hypothetical protein